MRHLRVVFLSATFLVVTCLDTAARAQATFEGLGLIPFGPPGPRDSHATAVSADGRVVVGSANSVGGGWSFRWTRETGMVRITESEFGNSIARAVSADGSVVVGTGLSNTGWAAYRWTESGTQVVAPPPPGRSSSATAVSGDGSTVVGHFDYGGGQKAFVWTPANGFADISNLGNGITLNTADAISADALTIAGVGKPPVNGHAFRVTSTGATDLGDLSGGQDISWPEDISGDGRVIVGFSSGPGRHTGYRWTSETGMKSLDTLPSRPDLAVFPSATNGDGSVVVGSVRSVNSPGELALSFIWDSVHGIRELDRVLQDYGADLSGWSNILPTSVSADGLTIAGGGINPRGEGEAWIATLPPAAVPEPCQGLLLCAVIATLIRCRPPRRD